MNFITVIAVLQSFTAGSRLISDGICKLSNPRQFNENNGHFIRKYMVFKKPDHLQAKLKVG